MIAADIALTAAKQPGGELLAVVGEHLLDPGRAGLMELAQEVRRCRGRVVSHMGRVL